MLGLFKIGCQLFVVTVLALLSVLKSWSLINICAMHAPPSPHNKFSRLEPSISWLIIIIIIMLLVFLLFCYVLKSRPTYQINEVDVCQRVVCQKREFAVRLSSSEV